MGAAATNRLERRPDLAPRGPATRSHLRVVEERDRGTNRDDRGPAQRGRRDETAARRPQPSSAPGARRRPEGTAPLERRSGVSATSGTATRPQARRRPAPTPVPAARPLRKRPQNRPLPPDLAALAQVQMFRARVEAKPNISKTPRLDLAQPLRAARHLRIAPKPRRIASILAPALVVVFLAMLGITTFQTRMAQDQVELDQLQAKVVKARLLRQELEREQADLRSPVRLGREATKLGMVPADAVGFVTVDGATYSGVLEHSGGLVGNEASSTP